MPCSFVQPDGPEAVEAVGKDGASGVVTVVRVSRGFDWVRGWPWDRDGAGGQGARTVSAV